MPARKQPVTSVSLPSESLVKAMYAAPDLADAYSIHLPSNASKDPEVLARFIFARLPPWMISLMKTRDALVSGFGLKTARHLKSIAAEESNGRVGIFKIYDKEPTELVLGEDDKHLNFRLSFLHSDSPSQLILSTVVHCHNRWGRLYILLIAPFHRLVVRSCLGNAARVGWPAGAAA